MRFWSRYGFVIGRSPALRRCARFGAGVAVSGVAILATGALVWAGSLPSGGSVVSGSVTFSSPNPTTLDITQTSTQAIINWNSFSIGKGETVNFFQPGASSSTLNRVTGSTPSWIAGIINAPGTILLINPNGITITRSGVINTGSFAASTANIKDSDYLSGKYQFQGNGASAAVINGGRINVSDGGFAALLGGQINNRGVIAARLGHVALGAGELITLDLSGDGFLSVAVPSNQLGNLVSANGALITNKGKIIANGGTVYLSAATASTILRDAVNIPGSIRVNTVGIHNGKIVLNGGPGGRISVSGTLLANGGRKHKGGSIAVSGHSVDIKGKLAANGSSGGNISVVSGADLWVSGDLSVKALNGQGGRIDLTGADVKVIGALIDAAGASGGGLVRIGGTFQGGHGDPASALYQSFIGRFGPLPDLAAAQTVTIDAGTHINVSATRSGDAGTAIVWSQQTTTFAGTISGLGGPQGGNGGFVEVSGKDHLELSGSFDLTASRGKFGTVLFDPGSINIQSGGNTYAGSDTLNNGYIDGLLAVADVVVDTNYATGANGSSGDITLLSGTAISWGAATTLTLNAARNIVFQSGSSISTSAGSVVLAAGNNASGVGTVIFQGSGAQVTETGGGSVTVYYNPAVFGTPDFNSAAVSGNLTAYMLVNNTGQFTAINNNLNRNYALATDLNFGTFNICDFNCFGVTYLEPLGTFSGLLDGRNHTVNFTVYSSGSFNQGLFTSIGSSGVVSNLNVTARIFSGFTIGGIAGTNNGKIVNSSANTNVQFAFDPNNALTTGNIHTGVVGGLVGSNNGQIINSSATLSTVGGADGVGTNVGGLVGINSGTITGSSSVGGTLHPEGSNSNNNPTIQYAVGGLVGLNTGGTITTSWSSATISDTGLAVTSTFDGGFVGFNQASISSSYATGTVNGGQVVGGFVGTNQGNITASFSTGSASANPGNGFSGDVGGFAGWNGIVLNGNTIGALPAASVTQSWTASHVSGTQTPLLRGFAALDGATNSNNYFDTTATGQSTAAKNQFGNDCGCGATGITTAVAYNSSSYSSAFFGTAMYMVNGYDRPLPTAMRTSSIGASAALQSAIQLELAGSNLSGNYTLNRDIDLSVVQTSTIWSASAGFGPIGGLSAAYTGTFDGQGHAVKNIFINQPGVATNFIGLFGNVGSGGVVKNVGVLGGSVTGVQVVGALVGSNAGTLLNDYATASVAGQNVVGGLVGSNTGSIGSSYATGNVNGTLGNGSQETGGLVGFNSGTITDAYATGNVSGGTQSSGQTAGGIAGTNNGTITNVYATGTVTGIAGKIGALVGDNTEIQQQVGPPPDYDVINVTVNHVINNGYWNTDTMGSATGNGVGTLNGGGGLSFAQMTNQTNFLNTFSGFNFNTTWAPPNQSGQGGDATAHTPGLYGPSNIIWLAGNNVARNYGDADPALSYALYGLRSGDPQWLITGLSLTSTAGQFSNVGIYNLSFGSPQATGRNGVAYRFTTSGTDTVNQRPLSGSAAITGIDKTYDGNTNAAGGSASLSAANGVVHNDTVTLSATSGTYADANVVGVESVTLNTVTLNNSNYSLGSLSYSGTGQIDPKLLSVALIGTVQKTYDGSNVATLTAANYGPLSGVLAGDAGSVSVNNPTTGTYSDANASASLKLVTVTGLQLSGGKAGNYAISSSVSGTVGEIDKRPLNGSTTISAIDKIYDATTAASGGTATLTDATNNNVVTGDVVVVSAASGSYTSANAGPQQSVTVNSVNIGNSNYSLGTLSVLGTGTISPRPLNGNASITGIDKTYDGNTTSPGGSVGLTVAANNVISGDTVNYSFISGTYDGANAGAHTISSPTGVALDNSNYSLGTLAVSLSGTVNPRPITVTADPNQTRIYGDANPTLTYTVGGQGLVTGESLAGALATSAAQTTSVGVYPITQGTVTNANNPNYAITYFGDNLSVTQRPLNGNASITGIDKTYDGSTASPGGGPVGLTALNNVVNGDAVTYSFTSGTYDGANAGPHNVAPSGVALDNSNYSLGTLNVSIAGTISPRPITVTADPNQTRIYGDANPALTYTVGGQGLVTGESLAGALATTATQTSSVGPYPITQGTVTNTNNPNYAITYFGDNLWVTQRPLNGNASITGVDKTYDGNTASPGGSTGLTALNNVVNGDIVTYSFTSGTYDGANAGAHTVSSPVNVGISNSNYSLGTLTVGISGTINPRPLNGTSVITGIDKTYDATAAAGAGQVVLGGGNNNIINGDAVTITVTGGTYDSPNAGARTIASNTIVGLAQNNANYSLGTIVVSGTGTISPAPLVITAVSNTKIYDTTTSAAAIPAVSGLKGADSVTGRSETYDTANVGTGKTLTVVTYTVNDGNNGANYSVLTVPNLTGVITPATLTYVANTATRFEGAPNPTFTGTVTGFLGTDTITNSTSGILLFTSPATSTSPPGLYAINGSGLSALNYIFVQAPGNATALTITQRPNNQFPNSNMIDNSPHEVNITFQNNATGPIPISFTPGRTGGIVTGALTDATGTANNGYNYQPISQYDPNQYSQFKLPGYQDDAGEATIFTIIARAIAPDHASDYLIDSFWNGTGAGWNGASGNNPLAGKVTFSDGVGHDVTPTDGNAFPIQPGATDFAALLKSGPVMIGGAPGQKPAEWLLATGLAPDGKAIICADPITGKFVELSYDTASKTVGGIAGFFDPKTKGLVSLADASGDVPPNAGGSALSTLQGFVPSTFFAVTVSK